MLFDPYLTLAQADPGAPGAPDTGAAPGPTATEGAPGSPDNGRPLGENGEGQFDGGGGLVWIFLIVILVIFWVMIIGGQRRERKKKEQMVAALQKNDRVQTIGGIIGTIVDIRDNEVTLKVDESSNTRMRFARGAIQQVLSDDHD